MICCELSSTAGRPARRKKTCQDACGTCIRSENRSKRSTRTDMTFVHLRSTKSRGHLSRITTPGLTSRRVAPRVIHSPPPALAAKRDEENIRAGGGRMTCQSRLKLLSTRFQSRHQFGSCIPPRHARAARRGNARKPRVLRSERKGCVPRFVVVGVGLSGLHSLTITRPSHKRCQTKTKSSSLISDDVRRHSSSGIALKGVDDASRGARQNLIHLALINSQPRVLARVDIRRGYTTAKSER